MKYWDFRTEEEKKNGLGYVTKCETCGYDLLVGVHHGRYCPVCGPETVANVSFTKMNGTSASLHTDWAVFDVDLQKQS